MTRSCVSATRPAAATPYTMTQALESQRPGAIVHPEPSATLSPTTTPAFTPQNKPTPLVGSWADYGWDNPPPANHAQQQGGGDAESPSGAGPKASSTTVTPLLPSNMQNKSSFDDGDKTPPNRASTDDYLSSLLQETAKLTDHDDAPPKRESTPPPDGQAGGRADPGRLPPAHMGGHGVQAHTQRAHVHPRGPSHIPAGYGPMLGQPQPMQAAGYGGQPFHQHGGGAGFHDHHAAFAAPHQHRGFHAHDGGHPHHGGPQMHQHHHQQHHAHHGGPGPHHQHHQGGPRGGHAMPHQPAPSAMPPPQVSKFTPPPPPSLQFAECVADADSGTPPNEVGDVLLRQAHRWYTKMETWMAAYPRERPSAPCPSAEQYATVEQWLEKMCAWYDANFTGRRTTARRETTSERGGGRGGRGGRGERRGGGGGGHHHQQGGGPGPHGHGQLPMPASGAQYSHSHDRAPPAAQWGGQQW